MGALIRTHCSHVGFGFREGVLQGSVRIQQTLTSTFRMMRLDDDVSNLIINVTGMRALINFSGKSAISGDHVEYRGLICV